MKSLWLALLTVREAIIKGTLIFYFIVGNLIILLLFFAIGTSFEGDTVTITMFGNQLTPRGIENFNAVEFILLQLFQSSTFAIMLFGVFATAGLIPSMLEKGTAELYLSKPLSRTSLLLARSLGACGGVAVNMMYFALGIWLLFGIKVGIWHSGFLLASLTTVVVFVFYYSVVALVGIISRSSGFAIMFAFMFYYFSAALEVREKTLYLWWDNGPYHRFLDALFYGSPQISSMLDNAARIIGTNPFRSMMQDQMQAGFEIESFLFSFLSASAFYAAAAWYFSRRDY